jgi:acetoin utilization deacetylase AcuC-like enzyme
MTIAYLTHPDCLKHDMGHHHPECPARINAINDQLTASGLLNLLKHFDAPKASIEQLTRVHSSEYVKWVFDKSPHSGTIQLDGDTAMNPHSLTAALRAAGSVVKAVNLVMSGEAKSAFCNVRPPGHHAGRNSAAGFCIFNNIAVGAVHALEHYGLQRVAIADFDVHHGNGTEEIFHDEPRVTLCSIFRHPYYPYCGADSGNNHIINIPLAAGSSGVEFRSAVNEYWLPSLEKFQPEFIFISAGFDAHRDDDMGGLSLVEDDYVWVTEKLKDIAARFAKGRIVSILEGGYALHALGRSALMHIKSLSDI